MRRKDCDQDGFRITDASRRRAARWMRLPALLALVCASHATSAVRAGSIRLWPSAVVTQDAIRVGDLCELRDFGVADEARLRRLRLVDAPEPGGSRVIPLELIQSVISAGGTNMALVTFGGARRCDVTRPTRSQAKVDGARHSVGADRLRPGSSRDRRTEAATTKSGVLDGRDPRTESAESPNVTGTLRNAIIRDINRDLARYGGRADVVFDQTSEQVLELAEPTYSFRIRRRNAAPIGMIQMEVDIVQDGCTIQTVPVVSRVSLIRQVVVARRPINQDATIQSDDVEPARLSFARLDDLGIGELAQVVGQRSKRFVAAGAMLDLSMLEPVPLVTRGQIVTLRSVSGSVRVVTTAKAMSDGLLGETITVRLAENRRNEIDAVVSGPGAAQIGVRGTDTAVNRMAAGDAR